MNIDNLSLVLKGTIFVIQDITIENIDVYGLLEKPDPTTRKIKLSGPNISDDGIVDVFIRLAAPNGQPQGEGHGYKQPLQ